MFALKTNDPTANIMVVWTSTSTRWASISQKKNFHIGSGVANSLLRIF